MTRLVRALTVKTASVLGALLVCLSSVPLAAGQTGPLAKPLMAEEVFKNVQVLKGVPADEFMGTMGLFSNALSADCSHCHVGAGGGGWAKYAEDNARKQTARKMVLMMNAINRDLLRRKTRRDLRLVSQRPQSSQT